MKIVEVAERIVAFAFILFAVPGSLVTAYAGQVYGHYPHEVVPLVFGGLFLTISIAGLVVLFVLFPRFKQRGADPEFGSTRRTEE